MLLGYREVQGAVAAVCPQVCYRLRKLLLKCRPLFIGIGVELEHGFWQAPVTQSPFSQEVFEQNSEMAVAHYVVEAVSIVGQYLPQAVYEREFVEMIDKTPEVTRDCHSLGQFGLKLIFFEILRKVENLEEGLEHTAGGPRGRDKLHEAFLQGSRRVPGDIFACIRIVDFSNAVSNGARSFQTDEKIRTSEYIKLFEHPGSADTQGLHLLPV